MVYTDDIRVISFKLLYYITAKCYSYPTNAPYVAKAFIDISIRHVRTFW